jgi:hypothetical protein
MMRQRRGLPRGTPPPQRAPDPSRPELDPRTCCSGWLVSGHVHDASQPGRRGAGHGSAACMTRGQFNRASRHRPPYEGNALPLRHTGPTPNGQARRSTAQLRRPLFPITRADSGVQVTRTTRLARPRASLPSTGCETPSLPSSLSSKSTIELGEELLYQLKAGPAARQPHDGHRGTGRTLHTRRGQSPHRVAACATLGPEAG